jgi:hypothetical protein
MWRRRLLFQVKPLDALSFTAAPLVLLPAAALATLLPAMLAASVDPARVLRGELTHVESAGLFVYGWRRRRQH